MTKWIERKKEELKNEMMQGNKTEETRWKERSKNKRRCKIIKEKRRDGNKEGRSKSKRNYAQR